MAAVLLLLFAASCESVLFIELEESDKLIVLNGALSNDSTVAVQVSRTRHILDNAGLVPLEDATVSLFRGGEMLEQLNYTGNGYFRSASIHPAVGEDLSIEVERPGYPMVSAHCDIPETVKIISVDTSRVIKEYDDYGYRYKVETFQMDVTINDPPGEENYYLLNLQVDKSYTSWRDTTVHYIDSLYHNGEWHYFISDSSYAIADIIRITDNPDLGSPDLLVEAITGDGILFSDQLIDGKQYSVRIFTFLQSIRSADSAVVDIRLHSISESYYRYLKSRQKHYDAKDDPFAVPVIVYSNVEGGVGFLGGYSSDMYTITAYVPEYDDDYWYFEYK